MLYVTNYSSKDETLFEQEFRGMIVRVIRRTSFVDDCGPTVETFASIESERRFPLGGDYDDPEMSYIQAERIFLNTFFKQWEEGTVDLEAAYKSVEDEIDRREREFNAWLQEIEELRDLCQQYRAKLDEDDVWHGLYAVKIGGERKEFDDITSLKEYLTDRRGFDIRKFE